MSWRATAMATVASRDLSTAEKMTKASSPATIMTTWPKDSRVLRPCLRGLGAGGGSARVGSNTAVCPFAPIWPPHPPNQSDNSNHGLTRDALRVFL